MGQSWFFEFPEGEYEICRYKERGWYTWEVYPPTGLSFEGNLHSYICESLAEAKEALGQASPPDDPDEFFDGEVV